jgi:hypothetical protein
LSSLTHSCIIEPTLIHHIHEISWVQRMMCVTHHLIMNFHHVMTLSSLKK